MIRRRIIRRELILYILYKKVKYHTVRILHYDILISYIIRIIHDGMIRV